MKKKKTAYTKWNYIKRFNITIGHHHHYSDATVKSGAQIDYTNRWRAPQPVRILHCARNDLLQEKKHAAALSMCRVRSMFLILFEKRIHYKLS